jgi:hypothetical protein
MSKLRWICAQIGAREHYALPRAFHLRGCLRTLYTEHWAGPAARWFRLGPAPVRSLAARFHPGLPSARVVSFSLAFFRDRFSRLASPQPRNTEEEYREYIRIGKLFSGMVRRHLCRQPLDPDGDAFIGYDTGCLETLEFLGERRLPTIVDQIDPGRFEEELVWRESEKWPGWQKLPGRVPDEYYDRLEQEWHSATRVMVNSNWSRQGLIQQGVPVAKIVVVPLAYEAAQPAATLRPNQDRPLSVLWLGCEYGIRRTCNP